MNKEALVKAIAAEATVSQKEASLILDRKQLRGDRK